MQVSRSVQLSTILSTHEWNLLCLLTDHPECQHSGRELADWEGISPTTASASLTKLLEAGLVNREFKGKAHLWSLNREDPTIAIWLLE